MVEPNGASKDAGMSVSSAGQVDSTLASIGNHSLDLNLGGSQASDNSQFSLKSATAVEMANGTSHDSSSSPELTKASPGQATKNSRFPLRPLKTRAMSNSSSVLARLTSRSSSHMSDEFVDSVSPTSPDESNDSALKGKMDRASLTKPKGKYKSGIDWHSSSVVLSSGDEPFMHSTSPTDEKTEVEVVPTLEESEIQAMAAAGSTKAALAWARSNSMGDPIFANHRRAVADASAQAALSASSTPGAPSLRVKTTTTRSAIDHGRPAIVRFDGVDANAEGHEQVTTSKEDERELRKSLQVLGQDDEMVAEAAEQVLTSAKTAAANADGVIGLASEEPEMPVVETETKVEDSKNQLSSKAAKRRTIFGFGGFKKSKDEKALADSPDAEEETSEAAAEASEEPPRRPDTESPVSTGQRRRRFNDTRQLNLLASELAAEALLGAPDSYATLSPEARRASMMSMLAGHNGEMGASPANASQISLNPNGYGSYANLPMPQPAFASEKRGSTSSASSSTRNMGDASRFDPPRAPFARSQHSLSTPSSPTLTQNAKLTGLPSDMLTGLGDGPYPTLPSRGFDMLDSQATSDGSWDQHSTGRGSLPDAFVRSRGGSAGSAQLPKRSVLQMTMVNPETELQGLTKPPKSGKSTPFGSRAGSKQVTPATSFNNMKEKYNGSAPASGSGQKAGTSSGGKVNGSSSPPLPRVQKDVSDGSSGGTTGDGKGDRPAARPARRSFFGRKSKSSTLSDGQQSTSTPASMSPPPMPAASPLLKSSPQMGSNPSEPTSSPRPPHDFQGVNGKAAGRDPHSTQNASSLVKVPSPSNSNTTTSTSSLEPGAFAHSSDGGSHQQGFSAVTTPEALPAKSDSTLQPEVPIYPSLMLDRRLDEAESRPPQPSSSPSPAPASQANMRAPNARNASWTSRTSSAGSAAKLAKIKSMFAAKGAPTTDVKAAKPVNTTPIKDYSRGREYSEKISGSNQAPSPLPKTTTMRKQDSQQSDNSDPQTFTNFRSKLQKKWLV